MIARRMEGLDPAAAGGLSEQEAAARLTREGPNELPSARRRGVATVALGILKEPMILLLGAAGTIYLVLGDRTEALILLASVFVVVAISLVQHVKTERALDALRDLSSPRALVFRDGRQRRIAGREVVCGDLLVVAEGDRVPADATLLAGFNVAADESLLTGESVPVRKRPWDGVAQPARPGGDDQPFLYSGTLVVAGQGLSRVHATGKATEIGRIGQALAGLEEEQTWLEKETDRVVRRLAAAGLALCALVAVVYGFSRLDWVRGLLAGVTLAMAVLPEEFPVVLTVFLALGAWRLAKSHVLTRRIPAIETLGSATVLCADKTGTLTQNRMTVRLLDDGRATWDTRTSAAAGLPEPFHALVEYAILASQRDPFDPMEQAIRALGQRELFGTEHFHDDWTLVREYSLSPGLLAVSHVWRSPDGEDFVIAAKGAPEAIADLCHLEPPVLAKLEERVRALAGDGLRVLGVARAHFRPGALPDGQHDFDFRFLGLIGLEDPVRPAVPAAVAECLAAGIRVVMITGDHAETAVSVARSIGLPSDDTVVTGVELDRMDDAALARRARTATLFARVVPEQKLRIVRAFQANGEVVGMTGDGVNDAPALKAAHIGIAMGQRGTDVAREAASLVLLDDDFSSLVEAVRAGRRIYANLQRAMAYLLAVHVPIAGVGLVPVLLGWPLLLLPVHVVFLEFLIDPACSIVFEAEPEEPDAMRRPPRPPGSRLFAAPTVALAVLQGLAVFAAVLAVYATAILRGLGEQDARAIGFTALVIGNMGLILTNRSWSRTILGSWKRPNPALWWVLGGACSVLAAVLLVPALRALFLFAPLHGDDLALCLAAGGLPILGFEVAKACGLTRPGGRDERRVGGSNGAGRG